MQEKYSNIIIEFLATHPAIAPTSIEKELKLPASTLRKAKKERLIPAKHIYPVICYLADYGLKIDGYSLTYDPMDNTLSGRKWMENVEMIEADGSFVYVVKEYRFLAAEYFDLL